MSRGRHGEFGVWWERCGLLAAHGDLGDSSYQVEVLLSSSGASEIAALVPSEVSGCNSARKDLANNNLRLRALEGQK